MKQIPQKARPAKQPPALDARAIFFEHLTEAEKHAMQCERKDDLPPKILGDAASAIEYAIMGGEANGFYVGFYYALQMMEGLRSGATPAAPSPIEAYRQQYDGELAQQGVPKNLRALLVANNVGLDELQAVVGKHGYFPADMPVCDYPQAFVDNCLVAAWPQVHNIILDNRK